MSATHCQCGGRSEVMETRESNGAIRRRRTCMSCGARWTTYERRIEDDAVLMLAAELADLSERFTETLKGKGAE